MQIVSFNINGIKARAESVCKFLESYAPEVVLMQEIKSEDAVFPRDLFGDRGYNVVVHGQKGFNGVAIASKYPIEDTSKGLPGDKTDTQARWIESIIDCKTPVRVCNLYAPNGNPIDSNKFTYKLAWMERLYKRARHLLTFEESLVLAGDYNVIPYPMDAANIADWYDDALFQIESRRALWKIMHLGFTDALRVCYPDQQHYTFWGYQGRAFERGNGIRIDHALLSPQTTDRLVDCGVFDAVRGEEKPSDHAPLWITLDD